MAHGQRTQALEYTGQILVIATLYFALGKPAMELAQGNSYASWLWPPAGIAAGMLIAFGGRLWPGVFLGNFLLNSFLLDAAWKDTDFSGFNIFPGALIAAGAALGAYAAYYLVRRFLGVPVVIEHPRDAIRLGVLVGPIAGLVSPTVGSLALLLAHKITAGEFYANWRSWWCGDAIGAVIFVPITLAFANAIRKVNAAGFRKGSFPVVTLAALVIPLVVTLVAWRQVSLQAEEKAGGRFERMVEESARAFQYRLEAYEQAMLSGIGLFAGSDSVSRDEWHNFAEAIRLRQRLPGLRGISFAQYLNPETLPKFLQERRAEGDPEFRVHPEGAEALYVLKYIEPRDGNEPALGFNLGAERWRREAAEIAAATGGPALTRRIELVQDDEKSPAFVMMVPLYYPGLPAATSAERWAALRGWVSAPFNAAPFLRDLTVAQGMDFDMTVYDTPDADPSRTVLQTGPDRDAQFVVSRVLPVEQHKWLFTWRSTPVFEKKVASSEAAIILFGGLLMTGLFGMLLTVLGKRADDVDRIVEMRTAELREREANLATVIDKLTQSNAELERFAYIVSHDMQEPIRAVANFSSLLWHQYETRLDAGGKKYLTIITESAKRLQAMVSDLLEYARVGQGARARERMDVDQLMRYVLDNLKVTIEEHDAQVTYGEMPVLHGYPVQFMSLMQNLINNGIKYQPPGNRPIVHVNASDRGDHYLFSVRDNGIGIDAANADKIFEPFKRLHSYQDYNGTGLGLSAARKIVDNHGGRIWVESGLGKGSTFFFTVMK
ncbi:MAG TPA: CHASE domain-containing protein [Patescibacteria group bacterium]|nr:CHASE domain-containing protein [Patescibacteria group bacterium]